MRWSKRSEYGLRAAIQLACAYDEGFVQTREISRRERLPNKFLEAILRAMKDGGLLVSKVGASGGYQLADRPENIPVGRLLRVLEGQLTRPELLKMPADAANARRGLVGLHILARMVDESMAKVIDQMTLAQLAELAIRAQGERNQMFYI